METDLTPPSGERYRALSLWWDGLPGDLSVRPGLPGDLEVDVAIVGGGLTGLWTAYYLSRGDPGLRIAVLERDVAGFGASGRNGGWCSALFSVSEATLDKPAGPGAGGAQRLAMQETVREVGARGRRRGHRLRLPPGRHRGTRPHPGPAAAHARRDRRGPPAAASARRTSLPLPRRGTRPGRGDRRIGWDLHPALCRRRPGPAGAGAGRCGRAPGRRPSTSAPRCGRSPPGSSTTDRGTVRAGTVVRATEGYTRTLAGHDRDLVPVYSLMIATEPLPDEFWDEAGLATARRSPTTATSSSTASAPRTAASPSAAAARPYHFGSTIRPEFDRDAGVHEALRRTLVELFPALADAEVTHAWGGPLGIARDWFSSVGMDRCDPAGVGRRLRRRRGVDHQSGRAHPARPDPRASPPT